jgi:aquaporin Z
MGYKLISKAVAEFLGTFILMSAFTNVTVNGNALGALAVASSLMIMIYSLGAVSGANFNPAVTIALAIMSCAKFPGINLPPLDAVVYIFMQLLGALCGALISTLIWLPHPFSSSSTLGSTSEAVLAGNITQPWRNAVIESTAYSHGDLNVLGSETLYTFVLVFVILNVATQNDTKPEKNWYFGLAIGFVIVAAATAVGGISFCCLNPAVSFGATLMNLFYAKVDNTLNAIGYWFGYSAFEILGALIACALFFVCRMHKRSGKAEKPSMVSRLLAEFLGTFVLCMTVQFVVNAAPSVIGAVGIASALMVMIYALGAVSGANFNPAVSFGLLCLCELKIGEFIAYVIAQVLGALFAVFVVWLVLGKLVVALVVKHGTGEVSGAAGGDWFAVLMAELFFTFLLVFTVLNVAIFDAPNQYYGLAIGFVVIVGAASVGSISGGCFNPAVAVSLDASAWWEGSDDGSTYGWAWLYSLAQLAAGGLAAGAVHAVRCAGDEDEYYLPDSGGESE